MNTFSKGTIKHPFRSPLIWKENKAKQNWNFPFHCVKGQHLLMLRDGDVVEKARWNVEWAVQSESACNTQLALRTETHFSARERLFHPSISEIFDRKDHHSCLSNLSQPDSIWFPSALKCMYKCNCQGLKGAHCGLSVQLKQMPREVLLQKN